MRLQPHLLQHNKWQILTEQMLWQAIVGTPAFVASGGTKTPCRSMTVFQNNCATGLRRQHDLGARSLSGILMKRHSRERIAPHGLWQSLTRSRRGCLQKMPRPSGEQIIRRRPCLLALQRAPPRTVRSLNRQRHAVTFLVSCRFLRRFSICAKVHHATRA